MNSSYQICISGAAKGESVEEGKALAIATGKALAKAGHTLMTGATVGLPNYAAESYKAAGGKISIGISPASSKIEHILKYRLPTEAYDLILYTGLHYVGRDAILIGSCDAVMTIGGRMGTLHEFTIAMETDKIIGSLMGAGGISNEIMDVLHAAGEPYEKKVVFGDDPEKLLAEMTKRLDVENKKYLKLYR